MTLTVFVVCLLSATAGVLAQGGDKRIISDPCSEYCLNGGTCFNQSTGPTCFCPREFSGTKCEIHPGTCPQPGDVSVCGGVPCETDVQCEYGQKCCELGCGGKSCTPVATRNPCIPDPFVCKNGGTCTSPLDRIICQCKSGFGGDRCENRVPVKIGTCIAEQIDGEFNCTRGCDKDNDCPGTQKCCNTGCERQCSSRIIIDPCSGYCSNGGTCSDPGNGPTCTCPPGYSGKTCEIHPGTCPVVKPDDASVCGGVPCETDVQCKPDQKCCALACGGTWCTPVVYPTPEPTPPQLTCLTAKCTANFVCRHIVDCLQSPFYPKCIPTSSLPKDVDSKCQSGGYNEAILIQSQAKSTSYRPLLCGGPAHVSTNTCPSDSVCVGRGYGSGHCCRGVFESQPS